MQSRRGFIKSTTLSGATTLLPLQIQSASASDAWLMPDEADRHAATWMAFGPSEAIWGKRLAAAAQDNLASIAQAIAQFEPVNMLVRQAEYETAARKCGPKVKLVVQDIDDLWIRDTGPVFVKSGAGLGGVNFNFNGWGNKQTHAADAKVAAGVAARANAQLVTSSLVLEGGGIEVDGEGTAIITESCVLNANRNPNVSKATCEAELQRVLGITKVIWLPGIAGKDITDGHTDFYARFAGPARVLAGLDTDPHSFDHDVNLRHLEILRGATDAKGRKLKVAVLPGPGFVRPKYKNNDFAAGYVNFYVCNGGVIAPQFGDAAADEKAGAILRDLFPQRKIVQLNVDAIAAGGGGIHCATQQQPL